jgi:hypothetical protein
MAYKIKRKKIEKAPYTPMGDFYFIDGKLYEKKKKKFIQIKFDPYFHEKT